MIHHGIIYDFFSANRINTLRQIINVQLRPT